MSWRHYLLLALLGAVVLTGVAAFQSAPGYMDADYYHASGLQLAAGRGFTEPFLWNYLDDPAGLPHASHAYWMPLGSMLAAAGAALFRSLSFTTSRLGFIVVAALVPPLTAALAWSFTSRRDLSMAAGLLAVFPAFYLPFLPVTDTFGIYMLLGGSFFLLLSRLTTSPNRFPMWIIYLGLGLIAGLMHLTRADGLMWLLLAFVAAWFFRAPSNEPRRRLATFGLGLLLALAGYLLVMLPWFARNISVFGAPLGPAGSKMLWLTNYDQIFAYPADTLTFSAWWGSGIAAILKARLWALEINMGRTLAEQGEIFLLPLIGIALWHFRKDGRIQLAGLGWLLTFAAMTFAFPFAGARGGFFHSGAAFQPLWWALAPLGLERIIEWGGRKRGWDVKQAGRIFRPALVVLAVLLTVVISWGRLSGMGQGWASEYNAYRHISAELDKNGAAPQDVVMVANPPGFYLASSNPSIAVPAGEVETLLAVARRYEAVYLVLEEGSIPADLLSVYENPQDYPDLVFLGEVGTARIFLIRQH